MSHVDNLTKQTEPDVDFNKAAEMAFAAPPEMSGAQLANQIEDAMGMQRELQGRNI